MPQNNSPTPWERAKFILTANYLKGQITDSMKPKEVWEMKAEFKAVAYNFSRLKKSIKEHKNQSDIDEAGFLHDISIYTLAKDLKHCWDGSEAQTLLKNDIAVLCHKQLKPELLWITRPQYQEFELKKF